MARAKTLYAGSRPPSVIVSARIAPELVSRLDWLTRNDDETDDRTQGIKNAIKSYVEDREDVCRKKGLTPP